MWHLFGRPAQLSIPTADKHPTLEDDKIVHVKRVSQILRYISTLQTGNGGGAGQFSFVRSAAEHSRPFYSNSGGINNEEEDVDGRVLLTTYDFQQLLVAAQAAGRRSTPFSFYATTTTTEQKSRKRTAWGTLKNESKTSASNNNSCCWLRLTRMASNGAKMIPQPSSDSPEIQSYLDRWSKSRKIPLKQLLTMKNLANAPQSSNAHVKRFLRLSQEHLHQKYLHRRLERIYNGLFEWGGANNNNGFDLIWGLGQAILKDDVDGTIVDGPLLEVKVEVELARDGALLIRPRHHSGVTWNRSVLAALESRETTSTKSKKWNQLADSLDPCQDINPSEPATYVPLLKQLAVECAAGGTFVPSSSCQASSLMLSSSSESGKLVVTDAWCLYASPRPSAVWARDALAFCEQPQNPTCASAATTRPPALWALTHGPSALERVCSYPEEKQIGKIRQEQRQASPVPYGNLGRHIHFPLPASEAQNRIAQLLLLENYPAVVCEGPPGTGKTHTIANIVCAYHCQGKRVLVTSKGSPALSVLRERLPPCVQQLCVDVSMRESVGMRQLQLTVERLANKVSWIHTEREQRRSEALLQEIDALKQELHEIDRRLSRNAEQKHSMIQTTAGQTLFETGLELIESVPWLMKTISNWDLEQVSTFYSQMKELVVDPPHDPVHHVKGYPTIPSSALISLAASRAGLATSYLKNLAKGAWASIPWLGNEMSRHCSHIQKQLDDITVHGSLPPSNAYDWNLVVRALEKQRAVQLFYRQVLDPLLQSEGWPDTLFYEEVSPSRRRIKTDMLQSLEAALNCKKLEKELGSNEEVKIAQECIHLDSRRTLVSSRILDLSEDFVACRVVVELSKNFTAEAQSALVKFAQVSGKSRFGKSSSSQPHKLTQRQRRKRQEYLDAFEKCVRYIPCWILTSSQISDYLPAECLFDLVVIDEASQSDISVLPGMLRGKQWLIVGDGKQVSPTESFVAEDQIEMLKSALPDSPFESSMLPGHSFFDLCAQAYPKGRVILREHFRCSPEIISYSNSEFYNDNLVPLRLPTSEERMSPSLMDVDLTEGKKTGKVNHEECDEIVRLIKEYVESCTLVRKRTIGVMSLVGDEQSRLIRGRLLDAIGPHTYKLHDILVGEPPSFQGAERDIVFLSLVCSPGSVVTQNQLMHAQRANVALSRARDRMVLVRSIESHHIPNEQDIKFSMLDFFERAKHQGETKDQEDDQATTGVYSYELGSRPALSIFRTRSERLLEKFMNDRGYKTQSMGVVWEDAICVEDANNESARAAICVEATGESRDEWAGLFEQQKSIERVGWKCLRVDGSSFLTNHGRALAHIEKFLSHAGVEPVRTLVDAETGDPPERQEDQMQVDVDADQETGVDGEPHANGAVRVQGNDEETETVAVVVSSEDEGDGKRTSTSTQASENYAAVLEDPVDQDGTNLLVVEPSKDDSAFSAGLGNGETASDYGNIAGLGFLHRSASASDAKSRVARLEDLPYPHLDDDDDLDKEEEPRASKRRTRQRLAVTQLLEDSDHDDEVNEARDTDGTVDNNGSASSSTTTRTRKRLRLDKYSKDSRWYPSRTDREGDVSYEEYIGEVIPEHDAHKEAANIMEIDHQSLADDEDENNHATADDDDNDSYVEEQDLKGALLK